jgi:microcystin-dependent protein
MTLLLPNDIEPLTPADAAEVEQNYTHIEQYVNREVIVRGGTVAMTAPLTLFGSPSQDQHAATKLYVDSFIPVGVIMPFGGVSAPAGGHWLLCDGTEYSTTTYPELFAALQYRFGGTGGAFKVPNLNGRVMVGRDATQTRFDAPGDNGGTWVMPVPKHHHVMSHNHGSFNSGNQSANHQHAMTHNHGTFKTSATGGKHDHSARFSTETGAAGAGYVARRNVDTSGTATAEVTIPGGDHQHDIDIPQFTGNTGSQSVSHTHAVDVPNYVGDTADTGTANAEHLPPYLVVSYIIRAD